MSEKEEKIDAYLKELGLDRRTKRYKKTKFMLMHRTRPLEKKTVLCRHKKNGDDTGVPDGEVTLIGGICPCSICGHQFMWECHEANGGKGCSCCSSICT